jgi:hypothetical protein
MSHPLDEHSLKAHRRLRLTVDIEAWLMQR